MCVAHDVCTRYFSRMLLSHTVRYLHESFQSAKLTEYIYKQETTHRTIYLEDQITTNQ